MNWIWYEGPEGVWMLLPENGSTPYGRIEPRKDYKTTVYICDISTVNVNRHFLVQRWEDSDLSSAQEELETRMRAMGLIREGDIASEEVRHLEKKKKNTKSERTMYSFVTDTSNALFDMHEDITRFYWWAGQDNVFLELHQEDEKDSVANISFHEEKCALLCRVTVNGKKHKKICRSVVTGITWIQEKIASQWHDQAVFLQG